MDTTQKGVVMREEFPCHAMWPATQYNLKLNVFIYSMDAKLMM